MRIYSTGIEGDVELRPVAVSVTVSGLGFLTMGLVLLLLVTRRGDVGMRYATVLLSIICVAAFAVGAFCLLSLFMLLGAHETALRIGAAVAVLGGTIGLVGLVLAAMGTRMPVAQTSTPLPGS